MFLSELLLQKLLEFTIKKVTDDNSKTCTLMKYVIEPVLTNHC